MRQLYDESRTTWTGPGLVRVFEGASLEWNVENIPTSGQYEIVVRYEQQVTTFLKLIKSASFN